MPPRSAYWTILIGESPTAFRAREAADLQPTLVQLQRTQPTAVMKWFERGRVWTSPEEAMEAQRAARQAHRARSRDWRPGGTHVDVGLAYKRAKQAKWDRLRGKDKPRPTRDAAEGEPGPPRDQREPRERRFGPPREHREHRAGPPRERREQRSGPPRERRDQRSGPPREQREHRAGPPRGDRRDARPEQTERPRSARPPRSGPPSGRTPSSRPPSGRPPSGRPPSGRPASGPPRGRKGPKDR